MISVFYDPCCPHCIALAQFLGDDTVLAAVRFDSLAISGIHRDMIYISVSRKEDQIAGSRVAYGDLRSHSRLRRAPWVRLVPPHT